MTNDGLFKDADTIIKQKKQIKDLKIKVKNLEGLEEIHRKNNGDLRLHITKIEKENLQYKKDIDRLSEERDNFETIMKSNASSR